MKNRENIFTKQQKYINNVCYNLLFFIVNNKRAAFYRTGNQYFNKNLFLNFHCYFPVIFSVPSCYFPVNKQNLFYIKKRKIKNKI